MRVITRLLLICLFIAQIACNAYGHENCGCMDSVHDTVRADYKQTELENSVILNENKILSEKLKQTNPAIEAKASLEQIAAENAMIRSESQMIAKHLRMIKDGMSEDEHIEMMEEYSEMVASHAVMFNKHKELFYKLNRQ